MNINLLKDSSQEEAYCYRQNNNKGWKNSLTTLLLFYGDIAEAHDRSEIGRAHV